MHEQEKIDLEIVKQEFLEKAKSFKELFAYQEKFFEDFLKIKLAFLSFMGVVIAIVFAHKVDFSHHFLMLLLLTSIIAFLLLTIELFRNFIDRTRALKNQHRRTILAKIRHIAKLNNHLDEYGKRAEVLLIQENEIEQRMLNMESLSGIIKYSGDRLSPFIFVVWLVIMNCMPILFLFEILEKL